MNFQIKNILEDLKTGVRKADVAQAQTKTGGLGYGQSILDPRFKQAVAAQGVSLKENPSQFLGAYASRLVVDAANDGTRSYWWRWNHPVGIAQKGAEVGVRGIESPTARSAAMLAIATPALASSGAYNLLNPGQMFRPTGYAQSYSETGAEDRRETAQPTQELFERFFLGRTGEPLKYATAKEEIPSLTPQRYGNYQNFLYNDKGVLGLGVLKATSENLQGYPEARMLGFPVTIPMVGGFTAGSIAASKAIASAGTPRQRAVRGVLGGLAGSVAGVAAGNLINEVIATANRPKLEELGDYQQGM
jgi:hypothetical protein